VRKLHLVGYTPDLEGLIFTARRGSKSGGYVVAIEDGLVDTIDEARRRRNGDVPVNDVAPATRDSGGGRPNRPESTLTPREIQARLRAGRSIAQVAAEARVDPDWVERFAVPIMAEQAQIVELAKATTYSKPRLGPSTQPLGASVAWNLADRGVQFPEDVLSSAWTAHQVHETLWRVRLSYRSRGRTQEAVWDLDVQTTQLVARNRLASQLAHIEKGRRRRPMSRLHAGAGADDDAEMEDEPLPSRSARKRSTRPTKGPAARKTAAGKTAVRKPAARKAAARKPAARKTAVRKQGARKAVSATKARTSSAAKPRKAVAKARGAAASKPRKASGARKANATSPRAPATSRPAKKTAKRTTAPKRPVKARATASVGAPARTSINRVAASKVAANRAVANRLTGDRAVGNTVTPERPRFVTREVSWQPPKSRISETSENVETARRVVTVTPPKPRPSPPPTIDLESLLDDTPPPSPPPPPRILNRRTARPARPPFGVRAAPAPAG
jgi:hypothetical protein